MLLLGIDVYEFAWKLGEWGESLKNTWIRDTIQNHLRISKIWVGRTRNLNQAQCKHKGIPCFLSSCSHLSPPFLLFISKNPSDCLMLRAWSLVSPAEVQAVLLAYDIHIHLLPVSRWSDSIWPCLSMCPLYLLISSLC